MSSLFSLQGRVAVVIGGTGELCGAMAEGFAGAGAHVILVGRDPVKAEARLAKIKAAGGSGEFKAGEATNKADLVKSMGAFNRLKPETFAEPNMAPYHPGALKAINELGLKVGS